MALKYEDIKKEFQDMVNNDPTVQKLWAKIKGGNASYATTGKLAQQVGKDLGKVLHKHAPLTNIDEWDLDDLLPKALGLDHSIVTTACKEVQENMNKDAGVSLKFQEPKFDWDRVNGLIKELRDHPDTFSDIENDFYSQLENFSRNVSDDAMFNNAGLAWRAGLRTVVIRIADPDCCKWCSEVAGKYYYDEVANQGNDVWRFHERCKCIVDYYTEKNGSAYRERVLDEEKPEKKK